ncbi:uncharacterized protein LOC108740098 [Agrilus planipennis]|uniref:Uncharacterized protein LOC108740098 n=1 Tax=Agrilus planipennis TaxID=224129 RepID=A0A1W4XBT0_AGRPL|nr:uncharacterized protein LOC108740098 [Agrilus planipennis]
MEDPNMVLKLAELLNVKTYHDYSDSEEEHLEEEEGTGDKSSHVGTKSKTKNKIELNKEQKERENKYRKIETKVTPEDFEFLNENTVNDDWKKTPQWDISYRQSVTPSDVFLQMGGKTPSTISCEDMIISVYLPEEKYHNIDLKVEKEILNLTSPRFKLSIPLPHPVDPQLGDAKWDNDTEKLIITLKMDREFDFIHF